MKRTAPIWLTIIIAVAGIVAGILLDRYVLNGNNNGNADNDRKVNAILNLIAQEYVDTLKLNKLVEMSIPEILSNLDPHTSYFSAEDVKKPSDVPNGTLRDIGIVFVLLNDTIGIETTIPGGASEKAGLLPGDRIVSIDGASIIGKKMTTGMVMKQLNGPSGSKVKLGIKRSSSDELLSFTVTRGKLPVSSVDAYYMIDKTTGFVKVNQFGRHTYEEFIHALTNLQEQGAKRYMIDLRGNGGGFMEIAILMVNEFLPANKPILSTHGRHKQDDKVFKSDGKGKFLNVEVAVLIDEFSASASEIFAGAMQDNDRGLIIGRRSFGKGLMQREFVMPDSSIIHLTTARYYTPSGRCIQKNYQVGYPDYYNEIMERLKRGELYSRDSIQIDKSQIFTTVHGRTVYGGGGIVPDIFVPRDFSGITAYYIDVLNAGLQQRYAFTYCDNNREALSKMTDYKQFLRTVPSNKAIIKDFASFAASAGITPRWYYINLSQDRIVSNLKALIARDAFGSQAYYPILNRNNATVQTALKALNKHKAAFPISQ